MEGVFIFTNGNYGLDLRYTILLLKVMRHPKSLVQPMLTYLYEGITCFVNGSPFFESPYLLQGGVQGHFKGTAMGLAARAKPLIPRSVKKMLLEWRHFFDALTEDDIIWDMTSTTTYIALGREERELLLIGAYSFAVYPISRCSRMLGNFHILPLVSFYCRAQYRDLGSFEDQLCLR